MRDPRTQPRDLEVLNGKPIRWLGAHLLKHSSPHLPPNAVAVELQAALNVAQLGPTRGPASKPMWHTAAMTSATTEDSVFY